MRFDHIDEHYIMYIYIYRYGYSYSMILGLCKKMMKEQLVLNFLHCQKNPNNVWRHSMCFQGRAFCQKDSALSHVCSILRMSWMPHFYKFALLHTVGHKSNQLPSQLSSLNKLNLNEKSFSQTLPTAPTRFGNTAILQVTLQSQSLPPWAGHVHPEARHSASHTIQLTELTSKFFFFGGGVKNGMSRRATACHSVSPRVTAPLGLIEWRHHEQICRFQISVHHIVVV